MWYEVKISVLRKDIQLSSYFSSHFSAFRTSSAFISQISVKYFAFLYCYTKGTNISWITGLTTIIVLSPVPLVSNFIGSYDRKLSIRKLGLRETEERPISNRLCRNLDQTRQIAMSQVCPDWYQELIWAILSSDRLAWNCHYRKPIRTCPGCSHKRFFMMLVDADFYSL